MSDLIERLGDMNKEAEHCITTKMTRIDELQAQLKQANAVVEAVVKLGKDCRYDANDWVLTPELAEKYVEPVYQQALAALETCADGHDFRPFRGSAKCKDCDEMADCTETGAELKGEK